MEGIFKKNISDNENENSNNTTSKKKSSLKIDLNLQEDNKEKMVILKKPKEETNEIKIILNKISSYNNSLSNKNNNKNFIKFKCLKEKCPYIPLLKYYEYTQTVSAICRNNHQYHVPLSEYFEKILKNLETPKYCEECLKKNSGQDGEETPEYFCTNCSFFLCKNCQVKHYTKHKIFELSKINTICPIHEKNKFSGFCRACKIDLCIHCLKDHENGKGHHSLVQYMYLIPSKEKIDKYKKQIKDEFDFIEKLKIILFDENGVKDENIKKILDDFFDRMKLKLYFYEIQIQTFEKIKLNINIIKNVTDLFLLRQQTFEGIYTPILLNFSEKKLEILNRILSIVLKYQIDDKKINLNLPDDTPKSYLTHFKFNHIYSIGPKKNVKFLYILKNGKFLACSDNDGLYIYDDSTYKELIHIPSEIDIIDLCENDKGLIFLLKKSMIEIIRLEENCLNYYTENKILFKYIDQVNFITCLNNGTIIVSRTKRTEGNLDIWMKSNFSDLTDNNNDGNDNGDNGNNNNNNDNKRNIFYAQDRRRNMFNIVNNNLRLGFMLRTARHNVNNFYQNNFLNLNNLNIANNQIDNTPNNIIINPNNNNNNNNNNAGNNNNNENNNNNNNDGNNNDDNDDDDDDDDEENKDENNNNNNNQNNTNNNIRNTNTNNNNIIINNNNSNNNTINQLGTIPNNNIITNNNIINNNNENNNENILIQEVPDMNQNNGINDIFNIINDNNNNNNNNNIDNAPATNNILLPNLNQINVNNNNTINNNTQNNNNRIINRIIHGRNRAPRPRPRFVHVIRFIRDQLQGLVHNLEQEELVLEDPSLISSVGIYGSKDNEITHIIKPVKRGYEINALIDWDDEYFICAEFYIEKRDLKAIKIYSKETYEPIKKKNKLKAKYCMKDKNSLIKINDNLLGVCYTIEEKEEIEYGISLISFKTRDEVSRYELPKFNLAKKICMNNHNYIFIFCKELLDKNDNAIKVLKIQDNELIQSSNYFYEDFLSTYIYNNNSLKDKEENKEKIDNINLNENNNIYTINNYEQNDMIDEREMNCISSMVKLTNDTFVCLKRDNSINCYKVEQ